jgi:hypothetical protein
MKFTANSFFEIAKKIRKNEEKDENITNLAMFQKFCFAVIFRNTVRVL